MRSDGYYILHISKKDDINRNIILAEYYANKYVYYIPSVAIAEMVWFHLPKRKQGNYDYFAEYRENGIPDDKASPIRVDSIIYRSNGYYHGNWTHCNNEEVYANITIKRYGDGKYDVFYGNRGVYDIANCTDIAVCPEKLSCE